MLMDIINNLNSSRVFAGIVMILLNIGSKYISVDIGRTFDSILGNPIMRKIFVFTIVFTATRDIVISIILTVLFFILVSYFFNEKSKLCIIPKKYHLDENYNISKEEIERAKHILQLAEKKEQKTNFEIETEKKKIYINRFKQKTALLKVL